MPQEGLENQGRQPSSFTQAPGYQRCLLSDHFKMPILLSYLLSLFQSETAAQSSLVFHDLETFEGQAFAECNMRFKHL